MNNIFQGALFLMCGAAWFLMAGVLALLALTGIAGNQGIFSFLNFWFVPGAIELSFIHVIGLLAAAGLCFVIGFGFFIYGLVPPVREQTASAA